MTGINVSSAFNFYKKYDFNQDGLSRQELMQGSVNNYLGIMDDISYGTANPVIVKENFDELMFSVQAYNNFDTFSTATGNTLSNDNPNTIGMYDILKVASNDGNIYNITPMDVKLQQQGMPQYVSPVSAQDTSSQANNNFSSFSLAYANNGNAMAIAVANNGNVINKANIENLNSNKNNVVVLPQNNNNIVEQNQLNTDSNTAISNTVQPVSESSEINEASVDQSIINTGIFKSIKVDGQTVVGSVNDDKIKGSNRDDLLIGREGDDKINGKDGNDWIFGGTGSDKLRGGKGNDFIYGGLGDDKIYGGKGDDILIGGTGDDLLDGGKGNNRIYTGFGNDKIKVNDGNNNIFVNSTNQHDTKQVIEAGDGNDRIVVDPEDGSINQYELETGDGNDIVELNIQGKYRTERPGWFSRNLLGSPQYTIYEDKGNKYNLKDFDSEKDTLVINGLDITL